VSDGAAITLGAFLVVPLVALTIERAVSWARRNGWGRLAWRLVPVALAAVALVTMASAFWWHGCIGRAGQLTRLGLGFFLLVAAAVLATLLGSDRTLDATRGQLAVRVVAVPLLALLAAGQVLPSLFGAGDRGAQKRTMRDMRALAEALELHRARTGALPDHGGSPAGLAAKVGAKALPVSDGWGHPFEVSSSAAGYTITSFGRCGELDARPGAGPTTSFDADIVFSSGAFVRWPDGSDG
jgi:hypothetical protein